MRLWRIVTAPVLVLAVFLTGWISGPARAADPAPVIVLNIDGAIGVGARHLLEEGLAQARQANAGLVVLRLDTPGGLVSVTREMIRAILSSSIPVAVYVAPSGARAASAGTYLAYAAHVAVMAPGTHLGAATPVQMGAPGLPGPSPSRPQPSKDDKEKGEAEQPGSAMERKILNDAIAYLRSLAQFRGRNAEWAEKAVRSAATLTAEEAAKENVIDVLADGIGDLLVKVDGRRVRMAEGELTLATRNARVIVVEAGWQTKLLAAITDPNIAFILLMIGVYGILFEFWSPGLQGPGIVGGISLVVALMALSALPVSLAGLALLVAGIGMMGVEAYTPGIGVIGLGGIVAFILGGMFLFDPAGADIAFRVAWPLVVGAGIANALLIVGLLGMILRIRRRKVVSGAEEMIGLEAVVTDWREDSGHVRVHGEMWSARAASALAPGAKVRVGRREGLTLIVEPAAKGG